MKILVLSFSKEIVKHIEWLKKKVKDADFNTFESWCSIILKRWYKMFLNNLVYTTMTQEEDKIV